MPTCIATVGYSLYSATKTRLDFGGRCATLEGGAGRCATLTRIQKKSGWSIFASFRFFNKSPASLGYCFTDNVSIQLICHILQVYKSKCKHDVCLHYNTDFTAFSSRYKFLFTFLSNDKICIRNVNFNNYICVFNIMIQPNRTSPEYWCWVSQ